jgi:ferredoxin-NADP reductase
MTAWLDHALGRVTMYRLLLMCLGALQVVAVALSLLGLVRPGDALAMVVSAAVLGGVSFLTHRLFTLVFRVRAHTPSSVITAQLLFFLLTPSLTPVGIGALALAAFLAVASKYLLAIRRRHVFNPAAVGAFSAALIGGAFGAFWYPVWWVGTPWLLPFVAIAGFLVLFRTRRMTIALTAIAVGLVAGVAQYVINGASALDALSIVALSSPLVFFAAFMVSEPLTLPPRRWQQIAYAAFVALLAQVTFSFGPLYNSPELALLVGNLLAFLAGQRRGIDLDFVERRRLTPTIWEFDFRPIAPVSYRAGQYMELTVPHSKSDARGWRRVFSTASAPSRDGLLRFGMRLPEPGSSFKRTMLELEPGARVSATAVSGDFVLPSDPRQPLLLVAGGIGITPYISYLEQIADEPERRDVVVIYAVSSNDDLAYRERLERSGHRVVVTSPSEPPGLPPSWTWLGPDRLTGEALLAAVPDAGRRNTYLSGPPAMVSALQRSLRRAGARRIRTDVFVGY